MVNFVSTDTDRIVNFCQSFHQFWSLPFQVAITLFLLYQQVSDYAMKQHIKYSQPPTPPPPPPPHQGWAIVPGWSGVHSSPHTHQSMAGSEDRQAEH